MRHSDDKQGYHFYNINGSIDVDKTCKSLKFKELRDKIDNLFKGHGVRSRGRVYDNIST